MDFSLTNYVPTIAQLGEKLVQAQKQLTTYEKWAVVQRRDGLPLLSETQRGLAACGVWISEAEVRDWSDEASLGVTERAV